MKENMNKNADFDEKNKEECNLYLIGGDVL